ncbi:MAG: hypothetical protein AAFR87_32455, partial [Bacteroidota bacterium]
YFVIINNSDVVARNVRVKFDRKIVGVQGRIVVSDLNIFDALDFLAPRKEIRVFIDVAQGYFARKGPPKIKLNLEWRNEGRKKFTRTIYHNLSIYEDMGYLGNIE